MSRLVRTKDLVKGSGPGATQGDTLTIDVEGYLPRGDKVLSEHDLEFVLGARRVVAGLELGIEGMSVGGEREMNVPPHLAYGDKGTATVPAKAALRLIVKLKSIKKAASQASSQT